MAAVVLALQPISAWQLAKLLRLDYAHVKRAVRELCRWNIFSASPEGVRFQPDPGFWEQATAPTHPGNVPGKTSKRPVSQSPGPEEVTLRWD